MRFPFRRGLAVALVSTEVAMAAVGAAWATERVELDDPAYGEVLKWIDAHYRLRMRQAETVRGDVDGDGIDDIVAIFNVHAGGASGEYQHMLVMKGTGTGYTAVGVREQIVGISPHDFVIGRGFVEYTGTIMGPTDPHCCPTTQQRFRVTVSAKGLSDSKPVKGPATAPAVTGDSTTQRPHPVPLPFPGVQPPPVPTVAPPRDARDAESLSAFIAFVKATQPERLRRDDVLGRLGAAQIAAQNRGFAERPGDAGPQGPDSFRDAAARWHDRDRMVPRVRRAGRRRAREMDRLPRAGPRLALSIGSCGPDS